MAASSATVSVVIPTHDRAALLPRALRSVTSQSHPALEVIVVDDGSRDCTRTLIAQDHPEIRYLHQPNRGVSAARNRGIAAAQGEWIALLDSDDEWLPDRLARQLTELQRRPGHLLCHSDEVWIRNGRRVNPMKKHAKGGGWIFRHCLPLCVISPSAALIHRDLFARVGLFDESLPACEDYDLWLRICAGHPVAFVDQPLIVKHGGHDDQLSRRHWGMDRFRLVALQKIIDSGGLGDADRRAAIATLRQKATILANGAAKRGHLADADRYRQLLSRYPAGQSA